MLIVALPHAHAVPSIPILIRRLQVAVAVVALYLGQASLLVIAKHPRITVRLAVPPPPFKILNRITSVAFSVQMSSPICRLVSFPV